MDDFCCACPNHKLTTHIPLFRGRSVAGATWVFEETVGITAIWSVDAPSGTMPTLIVRPFGPAHRPAGLWIGSILRSISTTERRPPCPVFGWPTLRYRHQTKTP